MNQNLCDLVGKFIKVRADGSVLMTSETGEENHPFDGAVLSRQPTEDEVHDDGAGVFIRVGNVVLTTEWYTTHQGDDVFVITGKEE